MSEQKKWPVNNLKENYVNLLILWEKACLQCLTSLDDIQKDHASEIEKYLTLRGFLFKKLHILEDLIFAKNIPLTEYIQNLKDKMILLDQIELLEVDIENRANKWLKDYNQNILINKQVKLIHKTYSQTTLT